MHQQSRTSIEGSLDLKIIRGGLHVFPTTPYPMTSELSLKQLLAHGLTAPDQPKHIQEWKTSNYKNFWRGYKNVALARGLHMAHMYGALWLKVFRENGSVEDLGLASLRVVTNNGVGFIVDAWGGTVEMEIMKYHGLGTGGTAEAAGDSALVTELTTQYIADNTRATGSLAEAAANIFRTVGTNTVDASAAITEHGIFSQAATGGGVLFDRSLFSVVNLASGDSLQSTYDATFTSGG